MRGKADLASLLAEKARRKPHATFESLESLLVDRDLFGLVTASPLQRAICRVAEGRALGELASDPAIASAFGDIEKLPTEKPRELVILSGIRVGKSLLAALLAVYWSQTCDVSRLGPGEIPRVSIVSITQDLAKVVFDHIRGRILASHRLSQLLAERPTADSILLRHPIGTVVEICVVSGTRAGSSLVARWSAGCIFDEFTRMNGEGEHIINWDDSRRAVRERILPGAQLVSVGSPWAPHGPAYEVYTSHFGKPSQELVVAKAPGWDFNPHFWTPENVERARQNPDTFQTECLGEFANPEEALFTLAEVEGCTRLQPIILSPDPRYAYRAAMDPATRGNGWTFVIATKSGKKKRIVMAWERRGSIVDPLSPKSVMEELATICRSYGITSIDTDIYLFEAIKDIAREFGLHLRQVSMSEREKAKKFLSLKQKMASQEIEIPSDKMLRDDLLQVRKRITPNGVKMILPKTGNGRHCDFAPSILLALSSYLEDEAPHTDLAQDAWAAEAKKMKEARFKQVREDLQKRSRRFSSFRR